MYFQRLPISTAVLTALALPPGAAFAQASGDTDAHLAALEQRIEVLQAALDEQQLLRSLSAQAAREKAAVAGANAVTATTNGRNLSFASSQGDYAFQIGGLLQAESAWHHSDDVPLGDGTQMRRLFLEVRGTAFRNWSYRYQYDLARPAGSDPATRGIRDAWIAYHGFAPTIITVGNHKQPFGMERLGSNLIPIFMERGVTDLFSPDRHIGISVKTNGADWSATLGLFGEKPESDVGAEGDEGWDVSGRVTYAPINDAGKLLHVGAAVRRNEPNDSTNELRFRTRPNVNVSGVRLIDTGVIPGVDDFVSVGLEAAAVRGPLTLQSEYVLTKVNRSGVLADLDFDAFYVQASWFLTGESRPYRVADGVFDRIAPQTTVGLGGIGAWELGVRYGTADLTDANVIGGKQEDLTVGLNWYPAPNLRLSANYVKVLDVDRPGNTADGDSPDIFALRAQVDF